MLKFVRISVIWVSIELVLINLIFEIKQIVSYVIMIPTIIITIIVVIIIHNLASKNNNKKIH